MTQLFVNVNMENSAVIKIFWQNPKVQQSTVHKTMGGSKLTDILHKWRDDADVSKPHLTSQQP
jgi:hypothetical protein